MNTFLPYKDFRKSAKVLDNKRLGKQRVEVLQILNTLTGKSKGWKHHPATLMWKGFEASLCNYGLYICEEWQMRGFKDTCHGKIFNILLQIDKMIAYPKFIGQKKFHRAYQSNLVRKDPIYYRKYFPKVPDNLKYTWGK